MQVHHISTAHVWANSWFAVYHPGNVLKMKDCPSREIKYWCMKNGSLWAIHNSFQAINAVTNRGNNPSWATHKPFWIAYQQNCFASVFFPLSFFSCWERRVIGLTGKQWYQVVEGGFATLITSCIFFSLKCHGDLICLNNSNHPSLSSLFCRTCVCCAGRCLSSYHK